MERDDGEEVDDDHDGAGDGDGPGQVPNWVLRRRGERVGGSALCYLHLLDDEVEIVPAGVGEEAGVEGESNDGHVSLGVLEGEELRLPVAQLDDASDGDEDEGEHLSVSEIVLDLKPD